MKRFHYYLQHDAMDCGFTCLRIGLFFLCLLAACAGGVQEGCSLLLERADSLLLVRPGNASGD